jgi:dipeptidyl-peptidase-4
VLIDTGAARVVEPTPYPRAGEPNPRVRVGIATVAGGSPRYIEMPAYSPDSIIVSDAGWLGDGKAFAYVQNRIQTWLDMIEIDAATGATKRLFRDQTPAWIESLGEPRVLPDRSFLVLSDRDGWKHLYHYEPDGKLRRQLTKGEWEVRSINRFDPESGAIYVIATKDNPIGTNLYKVTIADGAIERLTQGAGTHSASVSPGGELVLDSWSSHDTPPQQALFDSTGKEVRKLESAGGGGPGQGQGRGAAGPRGKRELFTIPARDGVALQAELTLPSDFDPEKKYPVWFTTYGGPHAPTISDSYFGGGASQATSRGFVSFRLDPRSASGQGSVSTWSAYKKLGVQETRDIEDGIEWLKKNKPYVDGDRIGMSGHSYGGFMTSFAMTHTKLFAAGIAGAPVTDWHDYDSIYTERFMQTPQDNPEGYAETSVVSAAGNLHGKLLILHGAIDDNVSMRNTMRLVHALQQANKDFELMIYPSSRHGIGGAHYQRLMVEFMTRTLGGPMPKSAAEKPEKVGNGESAPAMP